jgi:hypothetical protein
MIDALTKWQVESNHPELLVNIFRGRATAGIGGEALRLRLYKEFTRQRA